jgi:3-dehydroquinate synthase
MAQTLSVNAPDGRYDIVIERGARARLNAILSGRRAVVVTNPVVDALHGEALAAGLSNAVKVDIPDGEKNKTLDSVAMLYWEFVRAGLDRGGVVVAFGGGVIGDTAGFAAATYMRGVSLIQVPTTLLAMVDSSVGGKVGVDLPEGKNLVGSFKQPEAVLIDPDYLSTLPPKEWRCGMAEVIKHGLLADPVLLDPAMWSPDRADELVRRAVQVKIDVVAQDPYEKGVRAHLNLGHTFGHAVEAVSQYAWAHGEAVGLGLVAAGRLSRRLGLCGDALPGRIEDVVAEMGLPTRLDGLDLDAVWAAMSTDKKWVSGTSRFVLLKDVGQPVVVEGVARDDVLAVLKSLAGHN